MSGKGQNLDAEYERLLNQERFILEVTERICGYMDEHDVSRAELARRLRKTKGYVSQLLAGGRNLTLRTVADMAEALQVNLELVMTARSVKRAKQNSPVIWREDKELWQRGRQGGDDAKQPRSGFAPAGESEIIALSV